MPQVVGTGVHWLGGCAIPLALILIGAIMADHIGEFHSANVWRSSVRYDESACHYVFLLMANFIPMTTVFSLVLAKLF